MRVLALNNQNAKMLADTKCNHVTTLIVVYLNNQKANVVTYGMLCSVENWAMPPAS
jgi:hypothetical protein